MMARPNPFPLLAHILNPSLRAYGAIYEWRSILHFTSEKIPHNIGRNVFPFSFQNWMSKEEAIFDYLIRAKNSPQVFCPLSSWNFK